MGRHLLEGDQTVQHNQLHIVVAFLHNQLNVALRCSLGGGERGGRRGGGEGRGREGVAYTHTHPKVIFVPLGSILGVLG